MKDCPNMLPRFEQDRMWLESRVKELLLEIKFRVANDAGHDVTFDKVIECFSKLQMLSTVSLIGTRDYFYRLRRNAMLDTLLELLDTVEVGKPLRGEMVQQGFRWLTEHNYDQLRKRLLTYYWLKRSRPDAVAIEVRCYPSETLFDEEELNNFGQVDQHLIQTALMNEVQPELGMRLRFPLDEDSAADCWKYSNRLLHYSIYESSIDANVDPISDGVGKFR